MKCSTYLFVLGLALSLSHQLKASTDDDDDDVSNSYESEPKPKQTKKKKRVVDDENDEIDDSSGGLRKGKSYLATVEILGIGTGLMSSASGVNLGTYRDPNALIEFNAVVSSNSGSSFSSTKSSDSDSSTSYESAAEGKAFDIAVRYKQFFGNSFYGYVGPSYRQTDATLKLRVTNGTVTSPSVDIASVTMRDLGVDGAIGHAWQWSKFTMGCDWVGVHIPVVRFKNDYDDKGFIPTTSQVSEMRRSFVSQARGPGLIALRFYLGASF